VRRSPAAGRIKTNDEAHLFSLNPSS
jgi:hypothetical protein